MKNIEDALFKLVTAGLEENNTCSFSEDVDWLKVFKIANMQGVAAICLDGLQKLNQKIVVPYPIKMQWIASTLKQEQMYKAQWLSAKSLAKFWHDAGLRVYVMKGFVLAYMYPRPSTRYSCDMDCFLTDEKGWGGEKGNSIVEKQGIDVDRSYYKNSKFCYKGLTIENHRYLLPIKGSKKAKRFEKWLRMQMVETADVKCIGDSYLQVPSEMFNAVYIMAHAQEHFFEEGIILKHVCDWAMLLKAYEGKVNWDEWKCVCKEYGMLSFGYAMSRLAHRVCGVSIPFDCPKDEKSDKRLLDDILHRKPAAKEKRSDTQVRIDLVKNMFSNSWKYRLFSDTNFLMFCGRRVWGYLFDKDLE